MLVMISSKCVPIDNRFHARRVNMGKIGLTISHDTSSLRLRGIPSISSTKFADKKLLETLVFLMVKTASLAWA